MLFLDLPEDVLYYALCLCDISSILSISQTNKYLHHIAFAPTIWMLLVEDLRNRNFVERLSAADIRTMSTQNLVAVVRRLIVGPESWSSPRIQSLQPFSRIRHKLATYFKPAPVDVNAPPAQACAPILLHPSIPSALPRRPLRTKILRGGNYALFYHGRGVEALGCWNVAEDSLVGTYRTSSTIIDFAAEVLHGGERANIVIRLHNSVSVCSVEIISWDFATGVTEQLSVTQYTDSELDYNSSPTICGSLALVRTYRRSSGTHIHSFIDFRAQRQCKLRLLSHVNSELVPGYFLHTTTSFSDNTQEIRLYSIASLSNFWTPVGDLNTTDALALSNILHVASTTIKLKGAPLRPGVIAVHEDPLQCGTYRVWLYNDYSEPRRLGGSTYRAQMSRFCLSLPATDGRQFTWRQKHCTPAERHERTRGISYSGHTPANFYWAPSGTQQRLLQPRIRPAPVVVEMIERMVCDWEKVAPYSGALTYFLDGSLVLYYFP
ncbi:hypothetical protein C8R44DRAFT_979919 [Mycena epipterygia]|nr:hypothetical protein C8R44DRAFT_979919 [Mycena epipterygia]